MSSRAIDKSRKNISIKAWDQSLNTFTTKYLLFQKYIFDHHIIAGFLKH